MLVHRRGKGQFMISISPGSTDLYTEILAKLRKMSSYGMQVLLYVFMFCLYIVKMGCFDSTYCAITATRMEIRVYIIM